MSLWRIEQLLERSSNHSVEPPPWARPHLIRLQCTPKSAARQSPSTTTTRGNPATVSSRRSPRRTGLARVIQHQVQLTGENSFLRLSEEEGGETTTQVSHWRVLISPHGMGHVAFLRSQLTAGERGYVNRCVNDIRRRPSQPLIQWRFHPHTVHRDRRLRSTQGPSDA